MIELQDILTRKEYEWLNDYKDRLCFICFGGSLSYGTNVPTSDIDIKGVLLPTKEELIGIHHFEQVEDSDTDTVLYEFNKFVKLASSCNPNVIEMLGNREYIIFNDVGLKLLENTDLFLSKKCVNTFGGYANAQLHRVNNALNSGDKLNSRNSKSDELKLNKHLMHLCRLYLTCLDLLKYKKIYTYRELDREELLDIRNGKFIQDGKLTEEFKDYLYKLDENLKLFNKDSDLSDTPDFKLIEKFIIDVNSSVVNNTIKVYDEPIYVKKIVKGNSYVKK